MRPWMLILLAALCGIAMGLGATVFELGPSPAGNVEAAFQLGLDGGQGPRVVVDTEEFDFGSMELDARDAHEFTIRNEGQSPLELREAGVSCGLCTEQSIKKNVLAPGEQTTVEVRWHANKQGRFSQSASISTNDPARPHLSFAVSGNVLSSHRVEPSDLVFSSVSVKEPQSADVQIYSYRQGQLEVLSTKLTDTETADKFEVRTEPMPKEMLEKDKDAKSGVVLHVTVKPGLPLGPLRQKIQLKLNLEGEPTVEVPITGNIVSDVLLVGRNWEADHGLLRFDSVSASEGAKAELFLQVYGAHRHQLHPKVAEVSAPEDLKVTIGEPVELDGGNSVRVPITVEIPRRPARFALGRRRRKTGGNLDRHRRCRWREAAVARTVRGSGMKRDGLIHRRTRFTPPAVQPACGLAILISTKKS